MTKFRNGVIVSDAVISEMGSDANATDGEIDVPVDAAKVKGILERDKDPLFVTLQILKNGVSKNKRHYSAEVVKDVAAQINASHPDGYSGHMTDEERKTKNPSVETIWLGAKVVEDANGNVSLYAKGYVPTYAKERREYLRTAKELGKKVAVSIYGTAKQAMYNAKLQAYDIKELALESVDWARSGSQGVDNDGTLILAREMVDYNKDKGDKNMDKVQAIKETTISEMKEHNPTLVTEIESGVTAVAEMADVRSTLGLDDKADVKATVSEMAAKIRTHELGDHINAQVKAPAARPVIRQMVLSEMATEAGQKETVKETVDRVLQTEDAKAIIKETASAPKVQPTNDDKSQVTARKFTTVTKKG